MSPDELAANVERLQFIELSGDGSKKPAKSWGGYSQEFEEAEHVHDYEDIQIHPNEHWAVVDIKDDKHTSFALLIFDIDIHKAPDAFDADRVGIPNDTLVTRSQNGGFHVYFKLTNHERGDLQESDFGLEAKIPFDIDIRGSAVTHHVVAPADIPGCGGPYEIVNDEEIKGVFDAQDAASTITLDERPLVDYDPDHRTSTDFDWDPEKEPPEEMPRCYFRGLELRKRAPDDANLNTHKVNVLTALSGLAAGYSPEEVKDHFLDEWAPQDGGVSLADEEKTEYQLDHLASHLERGDYSPPAESTLADYGILEPGERCSENCPIDYHGPEGNGDRSDPSADVHARTELAVENGGYGYWRTNKETGESWFDRVTNFTLEVDSFLFNDGERLIKMSVVPGTGEEEYDVTVPTKVFNDVRRFRDNVVTGLTTTFDGTASDLNELRKLVGGQDAPKRTGTHHMGLHPDTGEFVTPQGVLTADGWIDDPETAYIEREISAERVWSLTPEENDDYNPHDVVEILELLPQSRYSNRFLPVMGWLYAAPLRPYIQEWEGQFNTLHVTGETGAGKSSTLSLAWQLLGMSGEPMACDDTKFALLTSMASTNSIPMWFDEYKPGDMKDWEVDRFQSLMRSTTRGGIATRGNADKSTEEYELKAPVMISGEQSIQGAAEERRSIQTRFRDGVKEPGSSTKEAFARLTGMAYDADGETREPDGYDLEQHGLAYYRYILSQDETTLQRLWRQSRDQVREILTTYDITGVDDLPRQGVQTIHYGMTLYRRFAEEMATEAGLNPEDLDLPTTKEENAALVYIAEQYGDGGSRKSHLDRFIELTARAATEGYLEYDKHFTFVKKGEPDEELALKLSSVHDRVSKYVRDHALGGEDLLNSARDYRNRMDEAAEDATSFVVTHSQNTPPLNRCARIDTQAAEDQLEFSRVDFGADPREDEDEASNEGDDPTPIAALELGRHDIVATVATVSEGEYNREAQGDLRGPHGTYVGFVVPGGNENQLHGLEGETVRLENVKMRTDDDGLREVIINDAATVTTQTGSQTGLDTPSSDGDEEAAADGGAEKGTRPDDAEGTRANAQDLAKVLSSEGARSPDSALTAPEVASKALDLDLSPDEVSHALKYGATKMQDPLFLRNPDEDGEDGYWLN